MVFTRYTLADSSKSGYSTKVAIAGTVVSSIGSVNSHFSGSGPTFDNSVVTEIFHFFENSLLH